MGNTGFARGTCSLGRNFIVRKEGPRPQNSIGIGGDCFTIVDFESVDITNGC